MSSTDPRTEYIYKLRELLQLEKSEDFEQHRNLIQRLSLEEKVKEGYCWYPLQVIKTGYAIGNRAYLLLERNQKQSKPDTFRAGASVQLFSQQPAVKEPTATGVIQYVDRNRMKVVLNSSDLPDWVSLGMTGVEIAFDERTYVEMEKTLQALLQARSGRIAELRDILCGHQPAQFFPAHTYTYPASGLNNSQQQAIDLILHARDLAIVHGPPGTGKTTTLVEAVRILCQTEKNILVTAPSNTAVDLLTERLAEAGVTVVRIGNLSRIDENIARHSLDFQVAHHPETKTIKKIRIQAAEVRRKARRFRRSFGEQEREERKALYREASELAAWADQLEKRVIDQLLSTTQVIAATLVGAVHPVLEGRTFSTVFIDEAAQAIEPASWIPICLAQRVVLAGDPFQLPPTVKSQRARKAGLHISLMERLIGLQAEATSLLRVQYRMHERIMGFSNQYFYGNQLQAAEEVQDRQLTYEIESPLLFIDTAGCGFEEQQHPAYQSKFNPAEFLIVCEHLYQLIGYYQDHELPSIAILSPYREQLLHMQKHIAADPVLSPLGIVVQTIDGYQGQERDVVYISLVRSNMKNDIGFLSDYRRMNVAMTRARMKLVVVGDSATIGADAFYGAFIDYCEKSDSYHTAWMYMR